MARFILWSAVLCSFFIVTLCRAFEDQDSGPSFADIFEKLTLDVTKAIDSFESLKDQIKSNLKTKAEQFIPLLQPLRYQTEDLIENLQKNVYDIVSNLTKEITDNKNVLGDTIKSIKIYHQNEVGKLIADIELAIRNKEYKLAGIILCINVTNDPDALNELLDEIFNYPDGKEKLVGLVKKNLINVIYFEYLKLSNGLREILKDKINHVIKHIKSDAYDFINKRIENIKSVVFDDIVVLESGHIATDEIDKLIDKLFDDINEHSKQTLEDAIDIDKDIVITVED